MNGARTFEEPGGLYFTGDIRPLIPAGQPGGGAGSAGITDLRWSDTLGGIEAQTAGEWVLKVPFEAFGA